MDRESYKDAWVRFFDEALEDGCEIEEAMAKADERLADWLAALADAAAHREEL